ncbi:beta strand repeat-containing protein, partial [bacterium]
NSSRMDVAGNIEVSGTVDGVDISEASQYFIDSAGTSGKVWKSDEVGKGYWGDDSNTPIVESEVEGYIANDVDTGYVAYDNGTKLVTSGIYYKSSTGNVGIGTSNPTQKLNLVSATVGEMYVYTKNANGGLYIGTETDGDNIIKATANKDILITDDANNGMIIKDGGNIGIGTAEPDVKLSVAGDMKLTGTLQSGTVPVARVTGLSSVATSGSYTDLSNKPSIAYESAIPADDLTQAEVDNMRAGKLDDGTTPWTSINADNIASGTLSNDRLATSITKIGQTIESSEITDGTITNADINASAGIAWSKVSKTGSAAGDIGALSSTGKAVDADKLDNIDSSSYTRSDEDDSITGRHTFTKTPEDTGVSKGTLYINPSANGGTDYTLIGAGVNGVSKFKVDVEGDADFSGVITGDGSGITNISGVNISAGTIANARLDEDLQDLADGSLTGSKVGTGISALNVTAGTLTSTVLDTDLQDLADGTLTGSKVGTGISASNVTAGTLTNTVLDTDLQDLADGTLSAGKVENGSYFIDSAGTSGQIWKSDGIGKGVWGTDITLSEAEVEGYIGNDVDTGYIAYDNGTKLATSGIYYKNSTGNIGIGTTGPTQKLHLKTVTTDEMYVYTNNANGGLYIGTESDGDNIIKATANKDILLTDDANNGMIIKEGGNIGIGTVTPDVKLSVVGDMKLTGTLQSGIVPSARITGLSTVATSGSYIDLTNKPNIAYTTAIPADDLTQVEVDNLRAGKLDDGTTPWTSIDAGNIATGLLENARLDEDLQDLADGILSAGKVENGIYFIDSAGTSGQVWKSDGDGKGYWGEDSNTPIEESV